MAWKAKALRISLGHASGLPAGRVLSLQLEDQKTLKFKVAPELNFGGEGAAFGAVYELQSAGAEVLQIATLSSVWVDVIDVTTMKSIASTGCDMPRVCGMSLKKLSFKVKANGRYFLQFNGSSKATLPVFISSKGS